MSATTLAAPIRVDTAGVHARPSIGRLVTVELRKMVDTRAGFWLQIARPPAGAIRACPLRFAALQRFELFPVALGCAQFVPRIDPRPADAAAPRQLCALVWTVSVVAAVGRRRRGTAPRFP